MKIIRNLILHNGLKSLLLFILLFFLIGCGNKYENGISGAQKSQMSTSKVSNQVLALEGDNRKQVSYLFYNEENNVKDIVLAFYANYNKRKIETVELLQGDTVVSKTVKPHNHSINNHGQFVISLSKYVEEFNKIRMFDPNGNVIFTLNTGQYYLEIVDIKNPDVDGPWYLNKYVTRENDNKFSMNAVFTKKGNDSYQCEVVLPRKIAQQKIVKQQFTTPITGNTMDFHYESQIAPADFKLYDNIEYELLVSQKSTKGQSYTIMNVNIPLNFKKQ